MHSSAMINGKCFIEKYLFSRDRMDILDVGSFDGNGSLRPLCEGPEWTYSGLDIEGTPEQNIDNHLLEDGSFPFDDGTFDVILSSSCLEHDKAFWLTFAEMIRVSRDGALIYINIPSEGPYHPYPRDCWRFMADAFEALVSSFPQAELLESYITDGGEWRDNIGIFRVNHNPPASEDIYTGEFFDNIHQESTASAKVVLSFLFEKIHPGKVVDVGCGSGAWLNVARELGAKEILGLDGTYAENKYVLESNTFLPVDLSLPIPVDGTFDLAISLEVAEHLPARRAQGFVADLVRLSDIILFAAAVPLQGGTNHLNEQWPDYWVSLFEKQGYHALDIIRPAIWEDERVNWWYRQNILLFCRESIISSRFPEAVIAKPASLRRIHECAYLNRGKYLERIARLERQLERLRAINTRREDQKRETEFALKALGLPANVGICELKEKLNEAGLKNKELLNSTCWKITYPLRLIKNWFSILSAKK
jgi:SAM-dependent methyltransferase